MRSGDFLYSKLMRFSRRVVLLTLIPQNMFHKQLWVDRTSVSVSRRDIQ